MRPRRITHKGRTQTLKDWVRELALSETTIAYRLNIRHSVRRALRRTRNTRGWPTKRPGVLLSGRARPHFSPPWTNGRKRTEFLAPEPSVNL
jgi:hypothetical protein